MGQGRLFVLSAPSGAGKSTLIQRLLREVEGLGFSVSHTTRPARASERDGVAYHFVDRDAFEAMVARDELAEWAQVHGNLYGTSFAALEAGRANGRDVLLDIDVQGALQLAERVEDAVLIFIRPPSIEELRRRLESRNSDAPEVIEARLRNAAGELAQADRYDYVVTNDVADEAVREVARIIATERTRRAKGIHA